MDNVTTLGQVQSAVTAAEKVRDLVSQKIIGLESAYCLGSREKEMLRDLKFEEKILATQIQLLKQGIDAQKQNDKIIELENRISQLEKKGQNQSE